MPRKKVCVGLCVARAPLRGHSAIASFPELEFQYSYVCHQVDSRVRALLQTCVKRRHRGLLVIVGDRGRDQVPAIMQCKSMLLKLTRNKEIMLKVNTILLKGELASFIANKHGSAQRSSCTYAYIFIYIYVCIHTYTHTRYFSGDP